MKFKIGATADALVGFLVNIHAKFVSTFFLFLEKIGS